MDHDELLSAQQRTRQRKGPIHAIRRRGARRGFGGYVAAIRAAQLGLSVAMSKPTTAAGRV